jgi:urease accessory protein
LNGRLILRAGLRNGRTVLLESAGTFPLQVLRPQAVGADGLSLVVLLSGGLLDGDEASIDVVVEAGARLMLRTQAATQVHAGRSRQCLNGTVGDHAWLSYLPHAVVPHAHADYHSLTVVEMQASARVLLAETLAPGRVSYGEHFAFTQVRLDLDVRREGELVARERALVRPAAAVHAAQFGGATHTTGVYALGPGEVEPELDQACGDIRIGRTPLARGGWYVRAVANRAAALDEVLQRLATQWAGRIRASCITSGAEVWTN